MSNFQPLEVVDHGSETQPLVVENLYILYFHLFQARIADVISSFK